MRTVDLRQIAPRLLDPLFAEETRVWLDDLLWDFRPSAELLRRFVEGRALNGRAAVADDRALGYGYYVMEEGKGLIGGLFVSQKIGRAAAAEAADSLLRQVIGEMREMERVRRVEAQVVPFGVTFEPTLTALGFALRTRQFKLLQLANAPERGAPMPEGLRIERWDDSHFEACARLIAVAYDGHVDSIINDQYRTEEGARKFLKNVVILPGCGRFQPDASFVVRAAGVRSAGDSPAKQTAAESAALQNAQGKDADGTAVHAISPDELVAAVLTSEVSRGVGHITQICARPEARGHGLGLRLMEATIRALRSRRFHALTLTVTRENTPAVALYEKIGFRTLKEFAAGVWQG